MFFYTSLAAISLFFLYDLKCNFFPENIIQYILKILKGRFLGHPVHFSIFFLLLLTYFKESDSLDTFFNHPLECKKVVYLSVFFIIENLFF